MASPIKQETQRFRKYYQAVEPVLKKPETKRYTAVVFSFLAVSLFGWYAIRPTVQTILHLKREIADNIVVNQRMEEKITALIEAQAAYQQAEPSLPVMAQALPESPELISFVAQLRTLAATHGVTLANVTVPPAPLFGATATASARRAKESKLIELPVSFAVSGTYQDTKAFVSDVAGMRRIAIVDDVSLIPLKDGQEASPSAETPAGRVQLAVKLKIHYLGQ